MCSQKYFNDDNDLEFLQNKFVIIKINCRMIDDTPSGKNIVQSCAYVSWQVVVDRGGWVLKKKKKDLHGKVAEAM